MGFEDSTRDHYIERPDLSPFIIHLTKRSPKRTAFENLVRILRSGRLVGSTSSEGYIKGSTPATCFMDVPLGSLKYVLKKANTRRRGRKGPRYEAYGILISKSWAYAAGARPVLYLSDAEIVALRIPDAHKWRVVKFEGVSSKDFGWLHEREWRAEGGFKLPSRMLSVLVKTSKEAERLHSKLLKAPKKFKARPRSILPIRIVSQGLPY